MSVTVQSLQDSVSVNNESSGAGRISILPAFLRFFVTMNLTNGRKVLAVNRVPETSDIGFIAKSASRLKKYISER